MPLLQGEIILITYNRMDKLKDITISALKYISFGAYHAYMLDKEFALQQQIRALQDEKVFEAVRKIEEASKKKAWLY